MLGPLKWTGSKRGQSKQILSYFPPEIDNYYEPFCGGASIALALLESDIRVKKYFLSDLNADVINLWKEIKHFPDRLITRYTEKWNILKNSADRNGYYMEIRAEFNKNRNPDDFFFINRTCFTGLIRYNSKNQFNSPFHFGRDGMLPDKLKKIIFKTSELLKKNDVIFSNCDFREIRPESNRDFVYLDPVYEGKNAVYSSKSDFGGIVEYLRSLSCSYICSYNGKRNENDSSVVFPPELYTNHIFTKSAKSGFGKLKNANADVKESLYIKNV